MIKTDGIGWRCPTNDAGEGFGFNESGMEHFAGDPFSALAREITQNTNDAVQVSPAFFCNLRPFKFRSQISQIGTSSLRS